MGIFRLRTQTTVCKHSFAIISFLFFRWHYRFHLNFIVLTLCFTILISFYQSSGLLYSFRVGYIQTNDPSAVSLRKKIIEQQKQDQKLAYEWLQNLSKSPLKYPDLFSNQTLQSQFYKYLQFSNNHPSSPYTLLNQSKETSFSNTTNHIVISILYSKQNSDYHEGKFYLGQVLHHLLENYNQRFLITLCENNNTDDDLSDGIKLIRQLVPVFIINTKTNSNMNPFEREKQAHLQCIQANFLSFPNIKHLLLLQDDAKPISKHFYYQLSSFIDHRIEQKWSPHRHRQYPAFIKLYHPKWLIGYLHPSIYILTQLIANSFILTCLYLFFYQVFTYRKINKVQFQPYSKLSFTSNRIYAIGICFCLFFSVMFIVVFLLDHVNISWTWRSLHPTFYALYPAPSCCIPGVLFFRQTYHEVIEYLESINCHKKYAIDTAFDDLPRRTGLRTYLIEPNLLHHIGLYSRLRKSYINPYLLD